MVGLFNSLLRRNVNFSSFDKEQSILIMNKTVFTYRSIAIGLG
jgi:hypothetical protein